MPTTNVTIVNALGLHARPASRLAEVASRYEADVQLVRDGVRANAKSILGLLTLACPQHSELTVEAQGPDADAALTAIAELFASGFGESDNS